MAQLINITSEALQATIRRLLPSQQGFGEDLQATNVVTPIIDLTPTAEGSILPTYLQRALSTDETFTNTENTTNDIVTTPGFYNLRIRVIGLTASNNASVGLREVSSGTRTLLYGVATTDNVELNNEFVVFVRSGYVLDVTSTTTGLIAQTYTSQLADVNGVLNDPAGFTSQ